MLIQYFLMAFFFVLILVPICKKIAFKYNIVDTPSEARKIHNGAKPYLGGVAIYLGSLFTYLIYTSGNVSINEMTIWIFGGLLVIVGVYDDMKNMRAYKKLIFQFLIAFGTCMYIPGFTQLNLGSFVIDFTTTQAVIIQSIWIVTLINAFNLIDGLDGLSSGLATISLSFLWIVMQMTGILVGDIYVVIMIGSLLAFLFYNFYPSTIFLGDAGSMFIGYYIGVITLSQYKSFTITTTGILVLVAFIPLLDILLAMIRRRANNQKIFSADALHFHHRLLRRGLSHGQAVLVMYGIMTVYAFGSLVMTTADGEVTKITFVILFIFTWLVIEYFYMLGDRFTIIRKNINRLKKRKK
ncbi:MraY family glycosyltransferase [Mollicutes bacterium LVI A0078]|nr:MraY family glycosyltransferase [Mollicutes bacterium LVI A0075]WOO90451.1 MraY family glycosyltransferase [Mollicutes bacterium LVI A0078]